MIVHSEVLAPSIPRHRRTTTALSDAVAVEYSSQAECEGINWDTLNCTDRCPRHWPIGYSAHGRHRSDRED